MHCNHCQKHYTRSLLLSKHLVFCDKNPDKQIRPKKAVSNQYIRAKELGLPKPTHIPYVMTDEDRARQSIVSRRANTEYWTEEKRKLHSEKMQEVLKNNPDSYTKNNVSGRVKLFEVIDGFGNLTKVKGSWEYNVAVWLNAHSIKWTNDIEPIPYMWNGKEHKYFPDFYINEFDHYIEVKGFETDRDHCKWNAMIKPLMIIREQEHKDLDNVLNKFIMHRE